MGGLNFRRWEIALLILSTLLAGASALMYFTDFPLRYYLFDLHDEGGTSKIGGVSTKTGGVRRQQARQTEFTNLSGDADLFDDDTVVTGPDGKAALRMNDGSVIHLDPGTMIKLSFDSEAGLGGVNRVATVNVITGKISGELSAPARAEKKIRFLSRGRDLGRVQHPPTPKGNKAADQESVTANDNSLTISASNEVPYVPPPAEAAPVAKIATPTAPPPPPSPSPRPAPPSPSPSPSPSPTPSPSPSPSPTPSPSPLAEVTGIRLMAPADGARFEVPKGSPKAEIKLTFSWMARPPGRDIVFAIWRLKPSGDGNGITREPIDRQTFKSKSVPSILGRVINKPGRFEWEILSGDGSSLSALGKSTGHFSVNREFDAIEVEDPLIGGVHGASNQIQDKLIDNFDVTLGWKPYPEAKQYQIQFFNPNDLTKPLKSIFTEETHHSLNKGKIFSGRLAFRVTAELPGGFVVGSPIKAFLFDFLPPKPVQPEPDAKLSQKTIQPDGILFTWQKTNFTESYDLEIARDPNFKQIVLKQNLPDNFLVVESPGPGTYFWRTRCHSKGVVSQSSVAARFVITP